MKKKMLSRVFAGAMAVMVTATSAGAPNVVLADETTPAPVTAPAADAAQGTNAAPATDAAQSTVPSRKTAATGTAAEDIRRVCVHDPSIVKDPDTGRYYVFGSHMATAASEDLVNWIQISSDYQYSKNDPIYGNVVENFAESFKWAGYADGDCKETDSKLAVWAPDVTWDEDYVWEDGSKGAYLLYYSASSTWKRSCIGVAVSKRIEGPYAYKDTLVYSGMSNIKATDGNSTRDTKWDNDYLNFNELIAKGSAGGGIDEVSESWFFEDGTYNISNCPNCIDPGIIKTADGKMYMSYGSWSGGFFMLEIDKATGLVIYPGKDGTDEASGNRVDRYYGIHIAGGNPTGSNVASGEAPYITYDASTGYYYLYETYGGLTKSGGYNMRLFRSKNVTGPYVDAAGNEAQNSGTDTFKYGIKLLGNYAFYNQPAYYAAGHNSALIDTDGLHYLVSHQRFENRGEAHEVRVRQQFMNEDGWPVTAVYENRNETIANYTDEAVAGTYEFINHGTAEKDGNLLATQLVTLNADGTISGEQTGTWKKTDSAKGYDYVTITIGDVTYKGVFFKQTNDLGETVMTFSAIGSNNESIWGSAFDMSDKDKVIGRTASNVALPSFTETDLTLPTEVNDVKISWKSDNKKVISDAGKVTKQSKDQTVTMTGTFTYQGASKEFEYKVDVYAKAKLIYGYDFGKVKGKKVSAAKDSAASKNASLKGSAKVVKDKTRGQVLKVTNKNATAGENSGDRGVNYLKLPTDTFKNVTKAGYSVSMWVNVDKDTWEHSALFEANSDVKTPAYPMTRIGANMVTRINANGFSDVFPANTGKRGTWQLVTYTVNANGIKVYLDGELIGEEVKDISGCFDTTSDFSIQKAVNVMVGAGNIWNDCDVQSAMFDDVRVYNGVLSAKQVKSIYTKTKK